MRGAPDRGGDHRGLPALLQAPVFPVGVSLCTWNSRALFGSVRSDQEKVAAKASMYRRLAAKYDITFDTRGP